MFYIYIYVYYVKLTWARHLSMKYSTIKCFFSFSKGKTSSFLSIGKISLMPSAGSVDSYLLCRRSKDYSRMNFSVVLYLYNDLSRAKPNRHSPDCTIARWKSPLLCGDTTWRRTQTAPEPWPWRVTRSGCPPNTAESKIVKSSHKNSK